MISADLEAISEISAMTTSPLITLSEKIQEAVLPRFIYRWFKTRKFSRFGEKEIHLVPFLADAHKTAIDIGANKGIWTHRLLKHCSNVYSFEPNPKMFRRLNKCFGHQSTVSPVAISNKSGTSVLRIPRTAGRYSSQLSTLSKVQQFDSFLSVTVETSKLDDMAIENVGFIKIDVEGFEMEVLEGAAKTIERYKPILVVEIEEKHTQRDLQESIGRVEAMGYGTYVIADGVLRNFHEAHDGNHHSRSGEYLFNFIFLPKS